MGRGHLRRAQQPGVAHRGAHVDGPVGPVQPVEAGDAVDVDKVGGGRQAEVEQRHQALAAGDDLRLVSSSARSRVASSTDVGRW